MGGGHLDVTFSDLGSILKYALNFYKKHKNITFIGDAFVCVYMYMNVYIMHTYVYVYIYSYLYGGGGHLDVTSTDLGSILKNALNFYKKHKSITFIVEIFFYVCI
jgi:hypothetical protein